MICNKYIYKYYYDLTDLFEYIMGEPYTNYLGLYSGKEDMYADLINAFGENKLLPEQLDTHVYTLFNEYLVPYHLFDTIIISPYEYPDLQNKPYVTFEREWHIWFGKFLSIINRTQSKYIKLISLYEAEANNLMQDIKTLSINRYNDTPQNSGDYSDDLHTSTINKHETSTPLVTKMARLEEIHRYWRDIYEEWAKEFRGIFIEGAN